MRCLQDLKYGLRLLSKSRGFTFVAALTLALGIGSSTAVFSIVNAILLKPLPYPHSESIVLPWRLAPRGLKLGYDKIPWGLPAVRFFWNEAKSFETLSAFEPDAFNLTGAGEPAHLQGVRASADFFPTLGVQPMLGRIFSAAEDKPGREHEVVLGYALWRDRFGSDPAIAGRQIRLNGASYTVTGVMPSGFTFPRREQMPGSFSFARETELWVPLALPAAPIHPDDPDEMALMGRLRHGVSLETAQAEMDTLGKRLEAGNPRAAGWYTSRVTPLARQVVGDTRRPLAMLLATVGVVLLIACANVAGLLLTRSLGRRREFTLRAALGAGRGDLIRQLLAESLLLAALGGAGGIAFAQAAIRALKLLGPATIPRLHEVSLDPAVLAFALAVTLGAGILFGLAPASGALGDLAGSLKSGNPKGGTAASPPMRNAMLAGQLALALVLTISAGLLVRTFYGLLGVDGGFRPQHVLTFELSLSEAKFGANKDRMAAFYSAALEKLRGVPAVEAAGLGEVAPMGGAGESTGIRIPGAPPLQKGEIRSANFTIISPGYFEAVGAPILRGRAIVPADTADSAPVALINRTMARQYWPDEDPIGKQVGPGSARYPASVIVGIVSDMKHLSLRDEPAPEMFVPYTQRPWPSMLAMEVVIRVRGDGAAVMPAAHAALHSLDPDLPVGEVSTLSELVDASMAQTRFSMLLVAAFGLLAVALTSIGMYGVASYSVAQRSREIGIRVALGASRADVFRMVLADGARLAAIGVAIGLAAALVSTRMLQSQLYGVNAADAPTFAAAALLLATVALVACYVPARRAMRVDPAIALRCD